MAFHTAAYRLSFNSAAETEITAIQDNVIPISNSRLQPQVDMGIAAVCGLGITQSLVRVNTPSLRLVNNPPQVPVNRVALPPTNPNVADKRSNPLQIKALEEILVTALQASGAGEVEVAVLWLTDGLVPAPRGNINSIRGTGSTTVVANSWTATPITWETALPNGLFSIVGLQAESTTGIACRLQLTGQTFRPGALCLATRGLRSHQMFYEGGLGEWGKFRQTAMPIPEFLCTAGDTVQTVYMQFIQVG